ncbi:MAG: hypothetical protein HY744_12670 [Deltaproteobacteria bacterium]|nr:hypothetical protein [Deltaproteobacteria bacterium]
MPVRPSDLTVLAASLILAAGCSEEEPAAAYSIHMAAWQVNFVQTAGTCTIKNHTTKLGSVDAHQAGSLVFDGQAGAYVTCQVAGAGSYSVDAQASQGQNSLWVRVPSITPAATKDEPATGMLRYRSLSTVDDFLSPDGTPCHFYFSQAPPQTVQPGKIWVEFACESIEDPGSNPLVECSLGPSWLIFQQCDG